MNTCICGAFGGDVCVSKQLRRTSAYGTDRNASVNTPKRREQNLFVHSGTSEAEVTNNSRLR